MSQAIDALTLTFLALFPIINPPGSALIFYSMTRRLTQPQRAELARHIAIYSFLIISVSFYIGAYVLQFFGISIPVLRVAGGIVVSLTAWKLLNDEIDEETEAKRSTRGQDLMKAGFYPLTMPLTTGPGTIAVTIALGAGRSTASQYLVPSLLGATTAMLLISAVIYGFYRFADRVETALGESASDAVARFFAFILMCIGIGILWSGVAELALQLR